MGRLRKPLEGRSEAHVGFRPRSMRSLAATSRNPFLLDFRSSWTTIVDMRVDQLRGKRPHGRQYAANWAFSFEPIGRSSREAILTRISPIFVHGGGFLKKSGHEARFLLVTPDRVAIPYSQSPPSEGCSTTVCDCTSGIKTPLPHAWRKRDERNTGYDWARMAITQLAMKNAIATRNRLREGAGKRRHGTRRATAEAGTRRDRRERSIQFAKYCEIIDSHNFASCFTPLERSEAR